jgi:HAD superfamily hydrolase (TIGR01484 family)
MKLYVSDLDGTLLRNNATLSEFSKRTLRDLIKQGVHFTVASARSLVSIRNFLDGVPLHLPVIAFNGAFISDLETGKHRIINHLNQSIVPELYELVKEHKCGTLFLVLMGKRTVYIILNCITRGWIGIIILVLDKKTLD